MNLSNQYFQFTLGHHHGKEVIWIIFDKIMNLFSFFGKTPRHAESRTQHNLNTKVGSINYR